jgi:serine/threonine-protein kinase
VPRIDLQAALEDRYTLEREVGEGGMATVFLAHDRKLHRSVALEVPKPAVVVVNWLLELEARLRSAP